MFLWSTVLFGTVVHRTLMILLLFSDLFPASVVVLAHARTITAKQNGTKTAGALYARGFQDTSARPAPPARWDQRKADSQSSIECPLDTSISKFRCMHTKPLHPENAALKPQTYLLFSSSSNKHRSQNHKLPTIYLCVYPPSTKSAVPVTNELLPPER